MPNSRPARGVTGSVWTPCVLPRIMISVIMETPQSLADHADHRFIVHMTGADLRVGHPWD